MQFIPGFPLIALLSVDVDSLIEAVKEKSFRSEGMCGGVRGGELQKLMHLQKGLVGGGGKG